MKLQSTKIKVFNSVLGLCFGLMLCTSCSVTEKKIENNKAALPKTTFNTLLVATTDYASGELMSVDLVSGEIKKIPAPIHSDAIVRGFLESSFYFVVNRLGADNIQWGDRLDKSHLTQFSVGRLTNPQDIAVVDLNQAYVSQLASDRLLKVNPSTGQILKKIDLFANASAEVKSTTDSDGFPEMTWMRLWQNRLLVLLQRIDTNEGFIPSDRSQLAILDINNDEVQKIIDLKRTNPVTQLKKCEDGLIVGEAGRLGALDGGIERFDSQLHSQGIVISEKDLGGDIIDCECLGAGNGLAIVVKNVYGGEPSTELISFSLTEGLVTGSVLNTGNFSLHQLLKDPEKDVFYLADRNPKSPSIWVYDAKTLKPYQNIKFDVGLPPYHMELVK